MFINYNKSNFNIRDIYNYTWFKRGLAIYDNDKLIDENQNLNGPVYMTFTEDKVTYCNLDTDKCDEYTYSYADGKITINSENYFMPQGIYNIDIKDDVLELSVEDGSVTIIYYFKYPLG